MLFMLLSKDPEHTCIMQSYGDIKGQGNMITMNSKVYFTNPLKRWYTVYSECVVSSPYSECVVSSPDRHALWAKDGLEQLLQILGSKRQTFFPLKKDVYCNKCLF